MFREVLSINTFSASHDNFSGSIKLTTMKRKTIMKTIFSVVCGLGCCWFGGGTGALADQGTVANSTPVRIGVYDSRAVAFAWFWSAPVQQQLQAQMVAARAAKQAGDTARFKELSSTVRSSAPPRWMTRWPR
jgi:hypothetical protein